MRGLGSVYPRHGKGAYEWKPRPLLEVPLIQITRTTPKIDTYVNAMAFVDMPIFGLLVALTGGVTDSSFVPLLLLVAVMAMIVQATAMSGVIKTFTVIVLMLVVLEIPAVRSVVEGLFGSYGWLLSFLGSDVRAAYEGSCDSLGYIPSVHALATVTQV